MYQRRWATGSDPQHPLDIFMCCYRNSGVGKGICGEGNDNRAPHNHGDTNIHSVYMLLEEHMHHIAMKRTPGS